VIDPLDSLAFSMEANRGVYALLVGSGVSFAAEIPTGEQITSELIRRLAHIKNEDCGSDPKAWYRQIFEEEPDYSILLSQIAKTQNDRFNLLKEFFEPSEEERQRAAKMPTAAHKAIAQLVSRDYIRVIITTNFDHLLEKAIEDIGKSPTVISTSDVAESALPIVHSNCTILKVNGDYLDPRIRNTYSELETYDDATNSLLDRIFDEFGLIVCGWSAEWDTALRRSLERCKNHRFSTYWTDISEPKEKAKRLIALRRGSFIPIDNADKFFRELSERVTAIETYRKPHPLSLEISIARLKKYLVDDRYRIELYDLINDEREKLYQNLSAEYYTVNPVKPPTLDDFADRIKNYEEATKTLLALMIHGCYWSKAASKALWVGCVERTAATKSDWSGRRNTYLYNLRLYPALILLYGGCIASLANSNYKNFSSLLTGPVIRDISEEYSAVIGLTCYEVLDVSTAQQLPIDEMLNKRTPINNRLYNILRDPLREFLADDIKYQRCFDKFEYLMALIHADIMKEQGRNPWGPEGCFSWRYRRFAGYNIFDEVGSEVSEAEDEWPLLKEGLFGGSISRFNSVKSKYDEYISKLRS
jgi:hypothetical protein